MKDHSLPDVLKWPNSRLHWGLASSLGELAHSDIAGCVKLLCPLEPAQELDTSL